MKFVKPLPDELALRYREWRENLSTGNKSLFRRLADEGQHPGVMVVSCCDSRVHVTSIFGAETGEFFIHRNIANLVPPFQPDGDHHGTSAAIEFGVGSLKISHILILGHSNCGGVNACYEMCQGLAPELEQHTSFVGRWLDILRPGVARVKKSHSASAQIAALEREGILISLKNLMGFPFVRDAVNTGNLTLHGLWHDIGSGTLEYYDDTTGAFEKV